MARAQKQTSVQRTPRIRAVTFDIGHTLLFPQPSLGAVYAAVAARHGIAIPAELAEQRFLVAWPRVQAQHAGLTYGADHASAKAFWLKVIRLVFADACPAEERLLPFLEDLYLTFGTAAAWRLNPAWAEVFVALRRRGIKVGAISNWDVRLRSLLEQVKLADAFAVLLISAEQGIEKPAAAIFQRALAWLGVPAESCLHIGDSWTDDVLGATGAGLVPVWFNPAGAARPDGDVACHEVRSLAEVAALVEEERC